MQSAPLLLDGQLCLCNFLFPINIKIIAHSEVSAPDVGLDHPQACSLMLIYAKMLLYDIENVSMPTMKDWDVHQKRIYISVRPITPAYVWTHLW